MLTPLDQITYALDELVLACEIENAEHISHDEAQRKARQEWLQLQQFAQEWDRYTETIRTKRSPKNKRYGDRHANT